MKMFRSVNYNKTETANRLAKGKTAIKQKDQRLQNQGNTLRRFDKGWQDCIGILTVQLLGKEVHKKQATCKKKIKNRFWNKIPSYKQKISNCVQLEDAKGC